MDNSLLIEKEELIKRLYEIDKQLNEAEQKNVIESKISPKVYEWLYLDKGSQKLEDKNIYSKIDNLESKVYYLSLQIEKLNSKIDNMNSKSVNQNKLPQTEDNNNNMFSRVNFKFDS